MKNRCMWLCVLVSLCLCSTVLAQGQPAPILLTMPERVEFDMTRPCEVLSVVNTSDQNVTLSGSLLLPTGVVPVTLTPAASGKCPETVASPASPATLAAGVSVLLAVQPDAAQLKLLQGTSGSLPGDLVLTSVGTGTRSTLSLPAQTRQPTNLALEFRQLVLWTGLLALLVAFGAWLISRTPVGASHTRVPLGRSMAAASWSQDKSWGTQVALLTGLASTFGGVVQLEGSEKLLVGFTGIVFAVLSLVAPMLYRSTQHIASGQLIGPVWGYLLSSVLTLWATFGGLVNINAFLNALALQLAPLGLGWLSTGLNAVTLALALIVCLFALRRVRQNIEQVGAYHSSLL